MPAHIRCQIPDRQVALAGVFPQDLAENVLESAVEYGGRDICASTRAITLRAAAGKHLIEQHSEGVHIARRSRRLAAQLLRAGVSRGHHAKPGGGWFRRMGWNIRIEQFRDAEIQQLGRAIGGDQNVAGLEVAMDHLMVVGVSYRLAYFFEKLEALRDRQLAVLAIAVNRLAVHVLHDEIWQAIFGGAAIQQAGDVRVIEIGEDLPLVAKTADNEVDLHAAPDQLDGYAPFELIVSAH